MEQCHKVNKANIWHKVLSNQFFMKQCPKQHKTHNKDQRNQWIPKSASSTVPWSVILNATF